MVKVSNNVEKAFIADLQRANSLSMLSGMEDSIVTTLVDSGEAESEDSARQYVDELVAQHIE